MIRITGADSSYAKRINASLSSVPDWYVRAARLSRVEVSRRQDVVDQIAMYQHGTRIMYIAPNVGGVLTKAIIHELTHGADDNFGSLHYFSQQDAWLRIHQAQMYFDIPKYRDEPLEYLADQAAKLWMWGSVKFRVTRPDEANFLETSMFPVLYEHFKG